MKKYISTFMSAKEKREGMTVAEAGRKGGQATRNRHGKNHFKRIGKKGGQKMKELIELGKKSKEANTDV